jgi:DNA-binding HxlR family transcriptional regulator
MSKLTVLKPPRESEERVLRALEDQERKSPIEKEQGFTQLKEKTGLSLRALSEALKRLQIAKMIERSPLSRKYSITKDGSNYLKVNETVENITLAPASLVKTCASPPVDAIVGINIPSFSKKQEKTLMAGTVDTAKAVFNQFLSDMKKANGFADDSEGVAVYTIRIDKKKVKDWLDTDKGKNYRVTNLNEEESP